MRAQEYLSQAYLLEQQIESKTQQISALRSVASNLHSLDTREVVTHTPDPTSMQNVIIRIMEMERELNAQIDQLVDLKLDISRIISRIQNINLRLVLEKRYLAYLSWNSVCEDLGRSRRWVMAMHSAALAVVQGILDEEESRP